MAGTQRKAHALVVLPGHSSGASGYGRWLAHARLERTAGGELLSQVLSALGMTPPSEGFGALRLWGQTGARPAGWVAAADPVYLEARLDHLFLHSMPAQELPETDVAEIFDGLQSVLGVDGQGRFANVGACGYLQDVQPMVTAGVSAVIAQGDSPGDYLPQGRHAKAHDRLQSEVQMCLHESAVNERRVRSGMRPINALWLWGGGCASAPLPMALPPLYADDPLMTGYWLSREAAVSPWPGDVEACLHRSPDGFVAVFPPDAEAAGHAPPPTLRRLLRRGGLRSMTLLFRDGLRADAGRWDALGFWRRFWRKPESAPG